MAATRAAVRRSLADLPVGARVLVACSGGADSLALAAAAAFVVRRNGLRAGAVVVDHAWRPESAQVCATAADQCRSLGLDPVLVVPLGQAGPRPNAGGGPEALARAGRYAALDAQAEELGAAVVLLGHTREDQAETVLLRLARGSGTRSLAGMPATRGRYRRPFLALPREVVHRACHAAGLVAWCDPANADPAYARSRVRDALALLVEALGPGLVPGLARSADLLRQDAVALDALAAELDRSARCSGPADAAYEGAAGTPGDTARTQRGPAGTPEGTGEAGEAGDPDTEDTEPGPQYRDLAVLAQAPAAIRRRALRLAALAAGSPAGALASTHVQAMEALVIDWHGQGPVSLPGRVEARRRCGRLAVEPAR